MTPLKPYLIRSIYEWITDNSLTPHLLVNAEYPGVNLPTDFVEDGRIVLNIRPEAIQGLVLDNDEIQFNARFSGKPMRINMPIPAVLAIYAKENGRGMVFDPEEMNEDQPEPPEPDNKPPQRPQLRVVK
ncbi:MAG: ClpXP protease specificity-enhancing factor [Methylomonas sp.]|nr:MAG: ClpXP protease specificity-enhancing factor [Methylomonas sp.]